FLLEELSASVSFIPKIHVKIIAPRNAIVSPTMYAHNVGPANAGIVVNPPKTNALPTTLNIHIKAPPSAATKQPATKGLLNLTPNPQKARSTIPDKKTQTIAVRQKFFNSLFRLRRKIAKAAPAIPKLAVAP